MRWSEQENMTYKEYYSTLNSIEEIKCAAADDIMALTIRSPELINIIVNAADEVLKEKFNYEVPELPFMCK